MILWLVAGAGQSLVNLPTQTLIADRTPATAQGRVYGALFAWSHLWWALSYPLAGWMGSNFPHDSFLYSSLVGSALLLVVQLTLSPRQLNLSPIENGIALTDSHDHEHEHEVIWHEHSHIHGKHHRHEHSGEVLLIRGLHSHPHQHTALRHRHPHQHDLHHYHHPF